MHPVFGQGTAPLYPYIVQNLLNTLNRVLIDDVQVTSFVKQFLL